MSVKQCYVLVAYILLFDVNVTVNKFNVEFPNRYGY